MNSIVPFFVCIAVFNILAYCVGLICIHTCMMSQNLISHKAYNPKRDPQDCMIPNNINHLLFSKATVATHSPTRSIVYLLPSYSNRTTAASNHSFSYPPCKFHTASPSSFTFNSKPHSLSTFMADSPPTANTF